MNNLYINQLEAENKQLRIALQECRKALEEEITTKKKAIEYIKDTPKIVKSIHLRDKGSNFIFIENKVKEELLEILKGEENE